MSDKLKIKISIANRVYPLTILPSQEEGLRIAAQKIEKTVKKIVEASIKFKVPVVTFFVLSTENWKRPKTEINFLFNLINSYFNSELNNVIKNGIKINIIGELNKLPKNCPFPVKTASIVSG